MAKIHPHQTVETTTSPDQSSSRRETFTIWMKSLVFHSNGCTVFNSEGDVAFRVDNYQQRCSRKVFLMDSTGNLLFSLNRKNSIFGCWEGYKWIDSDVRMETPWFRVRRNRAIFSKDLSCQVSLECCDKNSSNNYYNIIGFEGKSTLKITDFSGKLLAEATEKQSSKGVGLGDDVLTLTVEAHVDQPLIMALVTVYGLINNKL